MRIMILFYFLLSLSLSCQSRKTEKKIASYPELDPYYSEKNMGYLVENGNTIFRLFAPRATEVKLVLFESYEAIQGAEYTMTKDEQGVWEYRTSGELYGQCYGYRVDGPKVKGEMFDPSIIIADPYSRAVITQNNYHHPAKSLIIDSSYDWVGDTWMKTPMEDLIIYEMHIRDMTAHLSSGVSYRGTYRGMTEKNQRGGLSYLLDLGINAVELLPVQEFGNIEVPYRDKTVPVYNSWNPYERNHWGYMTSYFFAPESYYASDGTMEKDQYNGIHGRQVSEFKDMIKELHRHGIAVIMDVVYNHVSQYDLNAFKHIDKKYYFRLDENDQFLSKSGCGNDFKTERSMSRRLILESIRYWMTEYHIDGFRFDLANLIDKETCDSILVMAQKINPNVYLIAEPWGDGYNPYGFSKRGWAAWNDKFRNAVKGQNPHDNLGFIFGQWEGDKRPKAMKRYVLGSIVAEGGQFQKVKHSINYLESHDDHTLGDFIRIGTGEVDEKARITNMKEHATLTEHQQKLNQLAALFLFTSQGPVMIHEGQEYARSKVIAKTKIPNERWGKMDHNSYEKDDETNHLNYEHKEWNNNLYLFYKGLIALRKAHSAFRRSKPEDIHFLECKNPFGVGFGLRSEDKTEFIVLLNGHSSESAQFKLPDGHWNIVVDEYHSGTEILRPGVYGAVNIPPATGMVFSRLHVHQTIK